MKARPILFSAPMIHALFHKRKTQTRRIVKNPDDGVSTCVNAGELFAHTKEGRWIKRPCPYGKPGDVLWVRETWTEGQDGTDCGPHRWPIYAAEYRDGSGAYKLFKPWKPSIFMPCKYSRFTLEITDVRVEQLQYISFDDCLAEGIISTKQWNEVTIEDIPVCKDQANLDPAWEAYAKSAYRRLWEAINGADSWADNPWVWALTFKVHQQNVDAFMNEREAA